MTENEAIKRMRYRVETATDIAGKGSDGKAYEDMEIAIKALEEIQKYQAIGTVKECKIYKETCEVSNLAQLSEYREVGTVEECRLAKERLIPKKAVIGKIFKTMGYYQCPICGGLLMRNEKFCNDCGQRISWQ